VTAAQTARFRGAAVLPGFLTSGFLFAMLVALLPRWGYHITADYRTIGGYFICLALGVIVPTESAAAFIRKSSISNQMAAGCGLASASLVLLAFIPLEASALWRMCGLLLVGFSAGLINSALFAALSAAYTRDVARAVSIGGILFGAGCLASALIVALTFYSLSVTGALLLLALVPGIFAFVYYRMNIPAINAQDQPSLRHAVRDFRSFGTVAFAALLFFQFGNEWAIAGWLPMFLIEELGISPKTSILLLALYWTALLVGRVVLFAILRRVGHGRLLLVSASAAAFGCILLFFTNNLFGATVSVLLIGFGYAAIYPLVAEKIGRRFTYYHPGLFNGIFTLALAGGMLAPGGLGMFADSYGIGVVAALPLIGTLMVVGLVLMIWLESKVTGR
jgi:FHS family glucose/mannose:H+ symporter-like MFS transporter